MKEFFLIQLLTCTTKNQHNTYKHLCTKIRVHDFFYFCHKSGFTFYYTFTIICTNCERGSIFLSSSYLLASFPNSLSNWSHIQSSNDSKSFAKSNKYQFSNFRMANLVDNIPIVANKYSFLSNSFILIIIFQSIYFKSRDPFTPGVTLKSYSQFSPSIFITSNGCETLINLPM